MVSAPAIQMPILVSCPRMRGEAKPQALSQSGGLTVASVFTAHRARLLFTYALFAVENLLKLLQPVAIGLAINGLLSGRYTGVYWFVAQHLAHLVISRGRQRYDTRVYNDVYSGLATQLITGQRAQSVNVSTVAARSALARNYIEFLELYVPLVIRAAFSIIGALAMLGWYDWRLAPLCILLLVPATVLNMIYSRRTLRLNRRLHDQLEQEVQIIERHDANEVRRHFDLLGGWRVKLSDAEATNFCQMELFVLAVMVGALVMFCTGGTTPPQPGDVFAVFRYVMLFMTGLDSVPRVVGQWSRLCDVRTRLGNS
jgi:ABC-type multidrug transport system fused ATPase/permease subunit